MDPLGGHACVEAALLHGRADHHLSARARHDVAARRAHDARGRGLAAQAQDLSLHGADRGRVGQIERAAPGPGGHDDVASLDGAGREPEAVDAVLARRDAEGVGTHHLAADLMQRAHDGTRIHVVIGRRDPATDTRREPRLDLPAAPARQPLGIELVRALELVDAPELLDVVGVRRHHQRAARAERGVEPRGLRQPCGERRPQARRLEVQPQQRLLAEHGLCDRRQHAGGNAGRA